ncbi:pirin-like C-terminal cupin domain-containing protein [Otariodibacter sp.]|uniref:pirin family protein n=1 Tax=Otariodibacter sp. TaxID=3030919 RepID=UPI0026039BEB|nr:pirin-like C-terminal cupin domain-containing protein [Otariodibacter sp.]
MKITKLSPKIKDVGGIPLTRTLPNIGIKTIGAWCFLDHAGPTTFNRGDRGMQVGPHPHTNLQTFTWMIEGEVLHKDSLGNEKIISSNQVNLMTAGTGLNRGISHTEQSVFALKETHEDYERNLNMVQLWIALPTDQNIEASFDYYPELPHWVENGAEFTLTTGSYTNHAGTVYTAPTKQYSKLIGLDVNLIEDDEVTLTMEKGMQYGILIIDGKLSIEGETYNKTELVYFDNEEIEQIRNVKVKANKGTRFMLLGGEPLKNKVLMWWNFVADNKAELEQSINDWNNNHPRFGQVNSELERTPSPLMPRGFKE